MARPASRCLLSCLVIGCAMTWGSAEALAAAEGDTLQVWLTSAGLDDAALSLLPRPVPGVDGVALDELVYCGPTTVLDGTPKGARAAAQGRFLALLTPAAKAGEGRALRAASGLLTPRDCKGGSATAAKRLGSLEGGPAGAVAEATAEIKDAALHLALGTVALVPSTRIPAGFEPWAAGEAGRAPPSPRWADLPLKALPLELGRGRSLSVNATAGFLADGVNVVLALVERRSWPTPATEPAQRGDMSGGANARFAFGWELAAEVLRKLEAGGPFLVETQQETFEVSRLSLTGNGAGARARGTVRARSVREDFQLTVALADADLKITEIHVEPNLADCSALGLLQRVGCSSQNAARSAAAAAATSSLASRYQGQLLRQLVGTQLVKLDLAGSRVQLRTDPLSFASAAAGLVGTVRLKVEPTP